jgi:pimeloyl-ACP methyl ester carboxylesterase
MPLQFGSVAHRRITVDDIDIFYREAGSPSNLTVVLSHGYPCSSYQFRNLMPMLANYWHLVAPDYPGFDFSATPDRSASTLRRLLS